MKTKYKVAAAIALALALFISGVLVQRSCYENRQKGAGTGEGLVPRNQAEVAKAKEEAARVPETVFRKPIVQIPFTKKKPLPVEAARLPIPEDRVAKTIRVEPEEGKSVDIIIDKKGAVFTATDTPPEVKVSSTVWKPRLAALTFSLGASVVYVKKPYYCLSADLIRIGRIYAGGDVGSDGKKLFAGISARLHLADLSLLGKWKILLAGGYSPVMSKAYFGITIKGGV